jgi:cysteine desulfurase family protein
MIYLDNAATTFPKPEIVFEYVDWVQRNCAVNTGRGSYKLAQEAMKISDRARIKFAELVHASSANSVVFTPSATVAANEVIYGLDWDGLKNVYVSPFEHNAVMRPLELVRDRFGISIYTLPFDKKTQELDKEEMERLFSMNTPDYVFINQISNVTGVIVPVNDIGYSAHEYGATVIVDGSQSVGIIEMDLRNSPIDYLIFAGHKNLYASWGIGGFVTNTSKSLNITLAGGTGSNSLDTNMHGYEAGSPNIIAIASLDKSLEWLNEIGIDVIDDHKHKLTKKLIEGLMSCNVELYIPEDDSIHTSVVSFNVPGYEPDEVGMILDQDFDIAVRTGYHCAPLIHKLIGTEERKGTVRVSVGYFNSEEDIDDLICAIQSL